MIPALWDLGKHPTTFDFAAFAVIAKTVGHHHVRFIYEERMADHKYPEWLAWRRFGNIVLPICRLAGLEFSVGKRVDGREYAYFAGTVEAMYREIKDIKKLKPTQLIEDRGYVTITLRESFRNAWCNSNKEAWTAFEQYLEKKNKNVMVLPECEHAPLDVEHRMAVYANADMNLGVNNGPMALCHFADVPYITINMLPPRPADTVGYDLEKLHIKTGFPSGSQYSFRTDRQIIVWERDTFENIVRSYEDMEAGKFNRVTVDEAAA